MTYIDFEFKDKTYQIDKYLADALNSICYNLKKDTDFVIIVSGSRKVRIGKSTLAMTIAGYMASALKKLDLNKDAFSIKNMYWESNEMISNVLSRDEKRSIFIYDEAREGLQAAKRTQMQGDLLDFFNEVGQNNNIYILCISDLFILKEEIAVGRSELCINCYKEYVNKNIDLFKDGVKHQITDFKLGNFKLYNDFAKNLMYDIYRTTHHKNYNSVRPTFPAGSFKMQWIVPEEEYRNKKRDALLRFKKIQEDKAQSKEKIKEKKGIREATTEKRNEILIDELRKRGMQDQEIAKMMNITSGGLSQIKAKRKSMFDTKPNFFTQKDDV